MPGYYYPNQIYTACAFIGFIFCIICFPWQNMSVWTIPICLYAGWVGIACLIMGLNSAIWTGNISDHAPIWCDISIHILVAIDIAISVSALSIALSVYHVTRIRMDTYTKDRERRWLIAYLGLGLGMPVLEVALYYIIQFNRYIIIEDVGCQMQYAATTIAYVLILGLPLFASTISLVFCFLNLYSLFKSLHSHRRILAHTSGGLSTSHYVRLILLSTCELITTTPLAVYSIHLTLSMFKPAPFSWHAIHSEYSHIVYVPSETWKADTLLRIQIELPRWITVACAFWLFLFFGNGVEARKNMKNAVKPLFNLLGVNLDYAAKK
ncbi:GPCR fungal pheromone mating factor [Cyathus striatus]|nr:GPCR fungal pheromone mating factor [Cyathus striatus]